MKQSNFQFSSPIIKKLSLDFTKKFDKDKELSINNTFNISISRHETENIAIVELNIVLNEDEKECNAPFSLNMVISSSFRWDDVYDEETLNSLLSINAPALLLSNARPIIATLTGNGQYPPYYIPFYNFAGNDD